MVSTSEAFFIMNCICSRSFLPIFLSGHTTVNVAWAYEVSYKLMATKKRKTIGPVLQVEGLAVAQPQQKHGQKRDRKEKDQPSGG